LKNLSPRGKKRDENSKEFNFSDLISSDLKRWWHKNVKKATEEKYEKIGFGLRLRLQESIFLYKNYLKGKPYYIRQPNQFLGKEYYSLEPDTLSIKGISAQQKRRIFKKYQEIVSKNFSKLFKLESRYL